MEFTTQKIRQEWAVHEEQIFGAEGNTEDWQSSTLNKSIEEGEATFKPIACTPLNEIQTKEDEMSTVVQDASDSKSKKKRRKKSMMKKKQTQRKSSSSSSVGSVPGDQNENDTDATSISNNTISSTNEESHKSAADPIELPKEIEKLTPIPSRVRDLDIHFFSDTEVGSGASRHGSRPSTPIQSDSEIEISHREKNEQGNLMTSSASWKWGELPTQGDADDANITSEDAKQAQRNSMLSNMFSFMKQSKKMRKVSAEGVYLSELDTEGMDPEVAALYFPPINKADPAMNILAAPEDDGESGNGTSLPHSPSSVEEPKSLDSDYDDGKATDNK